MQAAADTVKAAVTGEKTSATGLKEYQRGYKPDPKGEKEAQGGEGSHPPGKQTVMLDQPIDDILADGSLYKGTGKFEGKVWLITGGDSGIGRSAAILAAYEGANVAIVYLPEEQKDAENVRDYINEKTNGLRKTLLLPLDLKSEANCIKAVEETVANFGRLDVLFNNAAQQLENQDLLTLDSKQWEDTFQLNMHSFFYMTKAAVPHLQKVKGSIVNNASVNAFIGRPDLLDYTSTKGAIVSFTRGCANQLASKDIRVNAVAPGPIVTPLVHSTFSADNIAGVNSGPLERPGQPVEVATGVIFLASNLASYITGNTLHINGGMFVH
ncbi:NAD(P)-binding protein [Rhodotorula sp. JG-1b]|nr:NAD(P)-binding protein [Rhodotorula sp. JG-1b]